MLMTFLQLVYDLFMTGSWLVHWFLMTCPQVVYDLSIFCLCLDQYLFTTCSLLVHELFPNFFSQLIHDLLIWALLLHSFFIIDSQLVHDLLKTCKWLSQDLSTTFITCSPTFQDLFCSWLLVFDFLMTSSQLVRDLFIWALLCPS